MAAGVTAPVYAFGRGHLKDPVFECPVSAIKPWIWDLLELFVQGRAMRLPVMPGGLTDQPVVVRRAWPVWEEATAALERERRSSVDVAVLASMLGARGPR